jgi:membrane protease YdiL (CAAX protease family)
MESKETTAGALFGSIGRALCYLLLFLLCQVLISGVYALTISLYAILNPGLSLDPMELIFACTDQISLISGLTTLVILAAFFLLRRKNPLRETGFHATHGRFVFTGIAITPLLYAAVSFVLSLLPEAWMEEYAEAAASLSQKGVLITIATVLVAPLVEEIIFRGLILSRLNRVIPGWLAVLLSALLFGVCHGQAVWMAYAFVLGVVFGFLSLRAKSIWPSLCAHILFNGIGQIAVYIPETEEAGMLFMGVLMGVGVVLCVITVLYRALRPLNPKQLS